MDCRILGLGMAYAGKGQFTDAIAHLTNATQMKCGSLLHGQMGYCYAMAGRRDEAQREIGILKARSESNYVSPMSFAAIYAGLGDVEEALAYLERAVEVRDTSLPVHLLSTEFDHSPQSSAISGSVRPHWIAAGRIRSQ